MSDNMPRTSFFEGPKAEENRKRLRSGDPGRLKEQRQKENLSPREQLDELLPQLSPEMKRRFAEERNAATKSAGEWPRVLARQIAEAQTYVEGKKRLVEAGSLEETMPWIGEGLTEKEWREKNRGDGEGGLDRAA